MTNDKSPFKARITVASVGMNHGCQATVRVLVPSHSIQSGWSWTAGSVIHETALLPWDARSQARSQAEEWCARNGYPVEADDGPRSRV